MILSRRFLHFQGACSKPAAFSYFFHSYPGASFLSCLCPRQTPVLAAKRPHPLHFQAEKGERAPENRRLQGSDLQPRLSDRKVQPAGKKGKVEHLAKQVQKVGKLSLTFFYCKVKRVKKILVLQSKQKKGSVVNIPVTPPEALGSGQETTPGFDLVCGAELCSKR